MVNETPGRRLIPLGSSSHTAQSLRGEEEAHARPPCSRPLGMHPTPRDLDPREISPKNGQTLTLAEGQGLGATTSPQSNTSADTAPQDTLPTQIQGGKPTPAPLQKPPAAGADACRRVQPLPSHIPGSAPVPQPWHCSPHPQVCQEGQVLRSPLHQSLQGKGAAPSSRSPEAHTAPASQRENSPLGLRVSSLLPATVFCQRQGPSWAARLVLTISLVKINTANISDSSCH